MLMLSIRPSLTWFVLDLNVTPFVVLREFSGIPIHFFLDIEGMTHGDAVQLVGPRAPEVGPTCAVSTSEYAGGCVGRMTHVFSPSGCTTISRPDSFSSTDLTRYGFSMFPAIYLFHASTAGSHTRSSIQCVVHSLCTDPKIKCVD